MRSVSRELHDLMKARTEVLQNLRIAIRKHAPRKIVDELRAEANDLRNRVDAATLRSAAC